MCLSISVEDEYSWLSWNSIVSPNPPLKFLAEMLPEIDRKEHEHIFSMGINIAPWNPSSFQIYSTTPFYRSTRIFFEVPSLGISTKDMSYSWKINGCKSCRTLNSSSFSRQPHQRFASPEAQRFSSWKAPLEGRQAMFIWGVSFLVF